jgi:hypothetical protein
MLMITAYYDKVQYAFGPFENREAADKFANRLDDAWNFPATDLLTINHGRSH